jgi:uncharacterized SAM-binding protein YcdF (DUF218 family)
LTEVLLFLAKLLALVASPIGAVLLLCFLGLILVRRRALARLLLVFAIVVLWTASMPAIANWLLAGLEAEYPPVAVDALPRADAIVVLGGALGQPLPPRIAPDLGEPADRIVHAARLYRAARAPNVLVAGGNLPWRMAVAPEAELVADLLAEFGVPRDAIVVETESRNTRENAVNSAAIMSERRWRTALLVTSGAHMPRAMAAFRRAGIAVTAAATDIRVRYPLFDGPLDFLPDAAALQRSSEAIRERIGLVVYRARGWT